TGGLGEQHVGRLVRSPWRRRQRPDAAVPRLSRRHFFAGLAGLGVGTSVAAWGAAQQERPLLAVFRPSVSAQALAPYSPALPSDQRPATYFLQQAGARTFAAVLARLDPTADYRPYFAINLAGAQPSLHHDV